MLGQKYWNVVIVHVENLTNTTWQSMLNGQREQQIYICSRKKMDHANQLLTIR